MQMWTGNVLLRENGSNSMITRGRLLIEFWDRSMITHDPCVHFKTEESQQRVDHAWTTGDA